jgi:hypothetical protein
MIACAKSSSWRDAPPRLQRFVRRKDHRPLPPVSLVDDVEEHIGRVGAVREIADLVDDEDGWMGVGRERVGELAGAKGGRQVVDQRRRRRRRRNRSEWLGTPRRGRDGSCRARVCRPGSATDPR